LQPRQIVLHRASGQHLPVLVAWKRGDPVAQPRQAESRRQIEIDVGDELDRALRRLRDLDDVERRVERVERGDPRREVVRHRLRLVLGDLGVDPRALGVVEQLRQARG
jgi:hypothetical protein